MATKTAKKIVTKKPEKTVAQLKELSIAFIKEIDNIMLETAKGNIDRATGSRVLGETVKKFNDIVETF